MAKFRVWIEETLSTNIDIEADNEGEAIRKVRDIYRRRDVILSDEDYVCTEFKTEELEEELE